MVRINTFTDEYFFLSNFYEVPVTYKGLTYPSTEAAFHAQKTGNFFQRLKCTRLDPLQSKRYGRTFRLRKNWDEIKCGIMHDIVKAKFTQNPDLGQKLIDTGDAYLVEGNTWKDTYWGVYNGHGENNLGRILMQVRQELKEEGYDTVG